MPGVSTPGRRLPGQETPSDTFAGETDHSAAGVAVDATGTTAVGTADTLEGQVLEVVVDPSAADFQFQVTVDGSPIFQSAQSPSAAEAETFTPSGAVDAAYYHGSAADIAFEVTAASATGGATADVTVTTADD
jgi:hypothetical protein